MRTLLLIVLLAAQSIPRNLKDPNDPTQSMMDREGTEKYRVQGSVKVPKSGEVTIPFTPEFVRPPSCVMNGGEVAEVTVDWIKLKNVRVKLLHYDCNGTKRRAQ